MVKLVYLSMVVLVCAGCQNNPSGPLVLCDFEADADLDQIHWKCRTLFALSGQHVTHGQRSLEMALFPSAYPGFQPILSHKDWRGFQTLRFDLFNSAAHDLQITVRIDDRKDSPEYADRYNKSFTLNPGMNHMVIPLDTLVTSQTERRMALGSIERFMVFLVQPTARTVLYLDYVRLVKER